MISPSGQLRHLPAGANWAMLTSQTLNSLVGIVANDLFPLRDDKGLEFISLRNILVFIRTSAVALVNAEFYVSRYLITHFILTILGCTYKFQG